MRTLLLFIFFSFAVGHGQTVPTNVLLTDKKISGNADKTSIIKIDIDSGEKTTYSIVVNYVGYFEYQFPTPLKISDKPISIWAEYEDGKKSEILKLTPKTDSQLLNDITSGKTTLPFKKLPEVKEEPAKDTIPKILNPEMFGIQQANTTFKYKTTIINTNFTIPVARFNTIKNSEANSKVGDIILFNSIGAGVGISWGEMEKTVDKNSETVNSDFSSSCGIHLGVLFSAGSGAESKNVFAPTVSFSVLDFQVGYGYELGTLEAGQKRDFWTIAYAIPLAKLVKGKHLVIASSKGYNSTNPLQIEDNTDKSTNRSLYKNSFLSKIKKTIWGYF